MGRRGPVQVPRRRVHRSLGRAARRCGRHPGLGEPALRPGRPRPPARRRPGRGGRRAADGGRRGSGAAAARRRRRRGSRCDVHGERLRCVGRGAHRPRVRGAGEHPRLRRHRRRARRDIRSHASTAAGRAAPGLPGRRPGRGRRQPRAAVGGAPRRRAGPGVRRALGRPRRPPRGRPRAAARGAPTAFCDPPGPVRAHASLAVDRDRRRASNRDHRVSHAARVRAARGLGGRREPRGATRRARNDRPGGAGAASRRELT